MRAQGERPGPGKSRLGPHRGLHTHAGRMRGRCPSLEAHFRLPTVGRRGWQSPGRCGTTSFPTAWFPPTLSSHFRRGCRGWRTCARTRWCWPRTTPPMPPPCARDSPHCTRSSSAAPWTKTTRPFPTPVRHPHIASLTVSPSLCLSLCLPHCVSHCVSLTASLSLCLPHCVSLTMSLSLCLSHRCLPHCLPHGVSHRVSLTACRPSPRREDRRLQLGHGQPVDRAQRDAAPRLQRHRAGRRRRLAARPAARLRALARCLPRVMRTSCVHHALASTGCTIACARALNGDEVNSNSCTPDALPA
jgi:hypothetical protein